VQGCRAAPFVGLARGAFGGTVLAARLAFVRIEQRVGQIAVLEARPDQVGAQDDVVVRHPEVFAEPAHGLKRLACDGDAGPGDHADLSRLDCKVLIAAHIGRKARKDMRGPAVNARHKPRVLHGSVCVQQPGPDRARPRQQGKPRHLAQPLGRACPGVVIQKNRQIALRLGHGKVVDPGKVEGLRVRKHADAL
jgi:hypothetical protein